MGWLQSVGSTKLQVSFAEYSLFYRSLWQKRPTILSILLYEAIPYLYVPLCIYYHYANRYIYLYIQLGGSNICVFLCTYILAICIQINIPVYPVGRGQHPRLSFHIHMRTKKALVYPAKRYVYTDEYIRISSWSYTYTDKSIWIPSWENCIPIQMNTFEYPVGQTRVQINLPEYPAGRNIYQGGIDR